jgi:hypothetical protein
VAPDDGFKGLTFGIEVPEPLLATSFVQVLQFLFERFSVN